LNKEKTVENIQQSRSRRRLKQISYNKTNKASRRELEPFELANDHARKNGLILREKRKSTPKK